MVPMLSLSALALAGALAACSPGTARQSDSDEGQMGMMGGSGERMSRGMMQDMMGSHAMGDMHAIRALLARHESIDRRVENIPGGVRTTTVSDDPETAELIRSHARDMRARYDRAQPIRMMDPLFRELFRTREQARMEITDIPGGVRVVHTSADPQVALLIRQHAHRFVSEAAEEGMRRAMRPTPLPQGYRLSRPADGENS